MTAATMMPASSWIAVAILVILIVAAAVWLWKWARRKDELARVEAVKRAQERLKHERIDVLREEQQRTDEEAMSRWKRWFGSPRRP
jgi:membrane protein implicated in regulation of membrane protease activity